MPARDELGVYILIFSAMGMLALLVPSILGLWVEADAAWHQVTIRDTDFTPTHIQLFYGVLPAGAVALVVASAPLLIIPNLGYNEWGHTFFYA